MKTLKSSCLPCDYWRYLVILQKIRFGTIEVNVSTCVYCFCQLILWHTHFFSHFQNWCITFSAYLKYCYYLSVGPRTTSTLSVTRFETTAIIRSESKGKIRLCLESPVTQWVCGCQNISNTGMFTAAIYSVFMFWKL